MSDDFGTEVWLRFESAVAEDASHEATVQTDADGGAVVEWSHTDVGLIRTERFSTREAARIWLEGNGYDDFTA